MQHHLFLIIASFKTIRFSAFRMFSTMFTEKSAFKYLFSVFLIFGATNACTTDIDCKRPNTYCYVSGVCVNCTNCSTFERYPGNGCAKDKNECGGCLPGTEGTLHTDGTLSVCHKINITPKPTDKEKGPEILLWQILLASGFLLSISTCAFFYFCRAKSTYLINKYRAYICERNHCAVNAVQPTAPMYELPEQKYHYQPIRATETIFDSEQNQQALPFNFPSYVRQNTNGVQPVEQNTQHNNVLEEDGDETNPSSWVPTGSEMSQPLSFRDALEASGVSTIRSNARSLTVLQNVAPVHSQLNAIQSDAGSENNTTNNNSAYNINMNMNLHIYNSNNNNNINNNCSDNTNCERALTQK